MTRAEVTEKFKRDHTALAGRSSEAMLALIDAEVEMEAIECARELEGVSTDDLATTRRHTTAALRLASAQTAFHAIQQESSVLGHYLKSELFRFAAERRA